MQQTIFSSLLIIEYQIDRHLRTARPADHGWFVCITYYIPRATTSLIGSAIARFAIIDVGAQWIHFLYFACAFQVLPGPVRASHRHFGGIKRTQLTDTTTYAVSSHPNHPLGDTAVDQITSNISFSFLYIFSLFFPLNIPTLSL
jgi:hypothetical protein